MYQLVLLWMLCCGCFVVDAMDGAGALHPSIKSLGDGRDFHCVAAGPALTVDTGPADKQQLDKDVAEGLTIPPAIVELLASDTFGMSNPESRPKA